MFLHVPTVIHIRRLLYTMILGRKYSIRSGTNNYFYRSWTRNLISNGRHYIAWPYLRGETYLPNTMVYEYSKQIYLLTNTSLWKKSINVQKSLMNAIKNIYIFKTELTTGILVTIKFQLIPVNFQIHYYSYPISENGLNKIYFKLITYNVFACANSDTHSSFTLYHHSWTKIQVTNIPLRVLLVRLQ
jgi:hypothetical protein